MRYNETTAGKPARAKKLVQHWVKNDSLSKPVFKHIYQCIHMYISWQAFGFANTIQCVFFFSNWVV